MCIYIGDPNRCLHIAALSWKELPIFLIKRIAIEIVPKIENVISEAKTNRRIIAARSARNAIANVSSVNV